MKNLIVILALVTSTFTFAQYTQTDASTISVNGTVEIPTSIKRYRAKVDLSLQEARYSNPNCYENFDEMKETFFKKLKDKGINKNEVTERKADFFSSGRRNEGTTFELVSADEQKVMDFISTVISGIYPKPIEYEMESDQSVFDKNVAKTMSELKDRAQLMAKELGLKIAKVNNVNLSQSRFYKKWTTYKEDGYVNVNVTYELE